jgi:methyl-accepting chemotaxis protein
MSAQNRKPLEQAIDRVREVSEGNLDIPIERSNSTNELGILTNSLTELVVNLNDIIAKIEANASTLLDASREISGAAASLSQGANEQASSLAGC